MHKGFIKLPIFLLVILFAVNLVSAVHGVNVNVNAQDPQVSATVIPGTVKVDYSQSKRTGYALVTADIIIRNDGDEDITYRGIQGQEPKTQTINGNGGSAGDQINIPVSAHSNKALSVSAYVPEGDAKSGNINLGLKINIKGVLTKIINLLFPSTGGEMVFLMLGFILTATGFVIAKKDNEKSF